MIDFQQLCYLAYDCIVEVYLIMEPSGFHCRDLGGSNMVTRLSLSFCGQASQVIKSQLLGRSLSMLHVLDLHYELFISAVELRT